MIECNQKHRIDNENKEQAKYYHPYKYGLEILTILKSCIKIIFTISIRYCACVIVSLFSTAF